VQEHAVAPDLLLLEGILIRKHPRRQALAPAPREYQLAFAPHRNIGQHRGAGAVRAVVSRALADVDHEILVAVEGHDNGSSFQGISETNNHGPPGSAA